MKELQRLVSIVTKNKLAQLEIPGKSKNENLNELYLLVCEGKVNSDNEAAKLLFGKTERCAAYQELSARLKESLMDMLLLIDVNQAVNENADRAYQEAWRLTSAAMVLARKGFIGQSIDYVDRALRLAIAFEYADIIVYLTKVFRKQTATFFGDEEKFEYYHQLYVEYSKRLQIEANVAEKYEQLMVLAVQPNAQNEEIARLGSSLFEEVAPLLDQCDYLSVHRYIRFIQLTYLLSKEAYAEVIEVCDATLAFFRSKTMDIRRTELGFMSSKLIACIQLQYFEEGMATLATATSLIDDTSEPIFFQFKELGFLLCLHARAYQEASNLLITVLSNTAIRQQACHSQKQWKVYQAYILYLETQNKVAPLPEESFALSIKLNKFLKRHPVFDKDKRNSNIPILIIQSLLLISQERYDEAQLTISILKQYTSRYLRQNDNFRSNCFIHMLAQLPLAGFHRTASIRYAGKYWKKLKSYPIELSNRPAETEIIPYEHLWEMLLNKLEMKRAKLKKIKYQQSKTS